MIEEKIWDRICRRLRRRYCLKGGFPRIILNRVLQTWTMQVLLPLWATCENMLPLCSCCAAISYSRKDLIVDNGIIMP